MLHCLNLVMQWLSLKRITLGYHQCDSNNRMIILTGGLFFVYFLGTMGTAISDYNRWLIIQDLTQNSGRRALYFDCSQVLTFSYFFLIQNVWQWDRPSMYIDWSFYFKFAILYERRRRSTTTCFRSLSRALHS